MIDKINLYRPLCLITIIGGGILTGATYFLDTSFFFGALAGWLVLTAFVLVKMYLISRSNQKFFRALRESLYGAQRESVAQYPIPTVMARENGEILWCNSLFRDQVMGGKELFGKSLYELIPEENYNTALAQGNCDVVLRDRQYTMYIVQTDRKTEPIYVVYLIDDHDLKVYSRKYFDSRPCVLLITIDNYSELFNDARENERSRIMGEIEHIIETFVEQNEGMVKKLDKDQYLAVIEDHHMREVFTRRFEILDQVRDVVTGDRISPTISIGVGYQEGASYHELEKFARQALDMALGRGGDQAAVKLKDGYEFYGGVSKGVEKRNKVRTRIVANAISEVVTTSDRVLVMGHRFADLDSLGAAIGVCAGIRMLAKPCNIVLDDKRNLVQLLYERMQKNGYEDIIIPPERALELVTKDTLLIIVDTHVKTIVESARLYEQCRNVVVIDHHRKMVNHIDNALIFFHEPYASSASEMAAELVQYFGQDRKITKWEAEAMLAGIMLDTKSFTIRTGVRTFEAAAYLRRMGADTVDVRKLFASSMEAYQQKTRLVSSAEIYKNCAIAYANFASEDIRIIAPQTADELLNINHVEASFVLYETDSGISFSARSMGEINVQVIMEALGGGGHLTMAGAQLTDITIESARQKLLEAIDTYFENNTNKSKGV